MYEIKLCQKKIQSPGETKDLNTIKGVQRNGKNGQCFETNEFGQTISVPVAFIKKVGIFEYRKEGKSAFIDAIHLSFLEFGCAGSLCASGVNLESELTKIQDNERYKAVVIYLAGMFANNASIDFLNKCKELCQNFLEVMDHVGRKKSIQEVFKDIMKRSLVGGEISGE